MIYFGVISEQEFLTNYWQKKPVLIKQALPNFISPITPDELAGLSLEKEFESRLITGSIANQEWSLLVQGVDRYIDEVYL